MRALPLVARVSPATQRLRPCLQVFGICMVFYGLTSYGGIRSPDSEIVFRTGESLALRGSFAVSGDLEGFEEFGVPVGKDGNRYSIFGPLQPLLIAPIIRLSHQINGTGWYEDPPLRIPPSHYVGDGLLQFLTGETAEPAGPHATRFLVSFYNVLVGGLLGVCFFLLADSLSGARRASFLVTLLFCFGSMTWPYSGTFFSEPLATLLLMSSLLFLVSMAEPSLIRLLLAGILLGLSVATHISAALCVPFFIAYAMYVAYRKVKFSGPVPAVAFLAGVGLVMVVLGYYNWARFGTVLETGRTAETGIVYAQFVAPWRGLSGLLVSGGKGLFLYCPAIILGILGWKHLHREHRFLSLTLVACILVRVLFIASRSDWHGGFSLGPRYLFMVVPLLLIPAVFLVDRLFRDGNRVLIGVVGFWTATCIVQQAYFSTGEIFTFFHKIKWDMSDRGVDVFENDQLYTSWEWSPLFHLLEGGTAPFLLQGSGMPAGLAWTLLSLLALLTLGTAVRRIAIFRWS